MSNENVVDDFAAVASLRNEEKGKKKEKKQLLTDLEVFLCARGRNSHYYQGHSDWWSTTTALHDSGGVSNVLAINKGPKHERQWPLSVYESLMIQECVWHSCKPLTNLSLLMSQPVAPAIIGLLNCNFAKTHCHGNWGESTFHHKGRLVIAATSKIRQQAALKVLYMEADLLFFLQK